MEALKHNFLLRGYFNKRGYEDSAGLAANRIGGLPQGTPIKSFTYTAKQLFDARDTAKLKNQKSLNAAGEFLAQTPFGVAVVVVSSGMEGDTNKELVLTEARAMVIRTYLVESFGFDDRALKTLGLGKQTGVSQDADWGTIQILIFPEGTEIPEAKLPSSVSSSTPDSGRSASATATTPKP
jgi:hypothetical protein